jgi:hypothetical protein
MPSPVATDLRKFQGIPTPRIDPRSIDDKKIRDAFQELARYFLMLHKELSGVSVASAGAGIVLVDADLNTGVTTTDIVDGVITSATGVLWSPLNLDAAAEIGAGNLWVSYPVAGTARINHTVSSRTRSFRFFLVS